MYEALWWCLGVCKIIFPQRKIDLQTELQATAVSVTLDKEITICSVYIPLSFSVNSQHLDSLLFNTLCTGKLIPENFKESSDPISDFTSTLIEISKECIPQTSTNPTKSNPWYNGDCKEAIKQRKQALSKFKKSPNSNNLNDVKVLRAKARRTIKLSKRKSWRSYVSKINNKTPIKKVWDMIRKIS